jgi:1,4-dihydroxy-2-naphthoyl-CoA hydrolase
MIWLKPYTLADLASFEGQYLMAHLDIRLTAIGDDFLQATMPVDERTWMPYRILHGGASCVLAESVGSIASALVVDTTQYRPAGLEINASHLRGVSNGLVMGTARPLRLGRTTHVWDIRITDEQDKLVCTSRLTMAILKW